MSNYKKEFHIIIDVGLNKNNIISNIKYNLTICNKLEYDQIK